MRTKWLGLRWLAMGLLCLSGCWTTQHKIKPPPHDEEFVKPPDGDPKYSSFQTYPRNTLFVDDITKRDNDGPGSSDPSQRSRQGFGAGGTH